LFMVQYSSYQAKINKQHYKEPIKSNILLYMMAVKN
jgi:hypothetical protein